MSYSVGFLSLIDLLDALGMSPIDNPSRGAEPVTEQAKGTDLQVLNSQIKLQG